MLRLLQSIIYSGALDIYIDGLNEVTAETRARIVQFAERNFHGNILLSTQRMEWTPPTTARLYVLQPLSDARISEFLASREPLLGERARLRGPEYREACERFVQQSLSSEQPEELRRAMRIRASVRLLPAGLARARRPRATGPRPPTLLRDSFGSPSGRARQGSVPIWEMTVLVCWTADRRPTPTRTWLSAVV